MYSAPQILIPQAIQSKKYGNAPFTSYFPEQKYNFNTLCELENTFRFISYAISSSATLGSREGLQNWKLPAVSVPGLQDNQFLACRIQSCSTTQLPQAASLPPARSESLTFTEKWHQGKQKIATQICKAFHILLMSR